MAKFTYAYKETELEIMKEDLAKFSQRVQEFLFSFFPVNIQETGKKCWITYVLGKSTMKLIYPVW